MSEFVNKALLFAIESHKSKFYDVDKPYVFHLVGVNSILLRFCKELSVNTYELETLMMATYLHDVLEDTDVKYKQIYNEFGLEVAEVVYRVTDELGRNREERHIKTYPKIKECRLASIIKLCDRIANVEYSKETNSTMFRKYLREYEGFKQGIYVEGIADSLWNHLDHLFK